MPCNAATVMQPSVGRLMSRYGVRTGRTTGQPTFHAGLDIGGPRRTTIYAPKAGVVEHVASNSAPTRSPFGGYGNAVVIRHPGDGVWTFYAHLHEALVTPGQTVEAGQPIGIMGATTNGKFPGMGAHLHMEVRGPKDDGSSPFPGAYGRFNVDPAIWLAEQGLGFSSDGLTFNPSRGACPSPPPFDIDSMPLERLQRLYPSTSYDDSPHARRLLVRDESAGGYALRGASPGGDYEPPIPDPDFFRGTPVWVHAAGAAGLALIGGTAFLVTR